VADLDSADELIQFAAWFIDERIDSLQRDVRHCLSGPRAPFPALLYCFSTIDLLGALWAGDASSNAKASKQASAFMVEFMGYTELQVYLLQHMFRHKMVHLAQPKGVIAHDGRLTGWECVYVHTEEHGELRDLPHPVPVEVPLGPPLACDSVFTIGIPDLADDIARSAKAYLLALVEDGEVQAHFLTTMHQIADPTVR
jgi:hypothetical protein